MRTLMAALVAVIVFLLAGAVFGQPAAICLPRGEMIRALERAHQERLRVQAPLDAGGVLEVYVSDDDRTWTMTRRGTTLDISCTLLSGTYWTETRRGAPGVDG